MSHYEKGNRSRENKSIFCRYACPQNPHLRIVNCGFSGFASLKLYLLFALDDDVDAKNS